MLAFCCLAVHADKLVPGYSAGELSRKSVDALSEETQNLVDLFNMQARDNFQLASEGQTHRQWGLLLLCFFFVG